MVGSGGAVAEAEGLGKLRNSSKDDTVSDNRRTGLTEGELDHIAEQIAGRINATGRCNLTPEQQQAVVDLIAMKKKAVRTTLWLVGALLAWVFYDVYKYIAGHIIWGGK